MRSSVATLAPSSGKHSRMPWAWMVLAPRVVKKLSLNFTTWKVIALKEANGENPQKRVSKEVNPREDQDYAADRRGARHDPSRTGPVS